MDDLGEVASATHVTNRGFVADIGLDHARARPEPGDVASFQSWIVEIVEVIGNDHLVAEFKQSFDDVRTDEPRAAGHKDVHRGTFSDAHVSHSLNTISVHSARA